MNSATGSASRAEARMASALGTQDRPALQTAPRVRAVDRHVTRLKTQRGDTLVSRGRGYTTDGPVILARRPASPGAQMNSRPSTSSAGTTGGEEVALVLATKAFLVIAGLANQSLLARLLAPEGRGAFAVCVMFGTILGVLFTPGSDRGAQYFVISGRYSISLGVSVGLFLSLVGSVLAIVASAPLIQSDFGFFQKAEPSSFYFALSLVPVTVVSTSLQLQLAGLRRFGRLAVFSVVHATVNLTAILILTWLAEWGVSGAILALSASNGVMVLLLLWDLHQNCGLRFETPAPSQFREVLTYGRKYYVARVGGMVDFKVGALFLAVFATQAEIGLFSAASALILRTFMISDSIESSLLPRVATDPSGRPELVAQCLRISALITGAALAGLVAFSIPLVRILLSDAFLSSVMLIWVMAPGVLLYGSSKILMAYFRGLNRPEICSLVVWSGLTVNIATLLVLYPISGLVAAGWAMSAGFAFRSLILAVAFRRVSGCSYRMTWLPERADLALLAGSGRQLLGRFVPSGDSVDA